MSITVNTNIASLNAQNNLNKAQNSLDTSLARLSSGLRINSAKDDAAGLAISDRMNAQVSGLNQAVRNANDGISMAQTAEGALQESTSMLQRIRDLAVQSANDTNSLGDRQNIQKEVTSLVSELDRISTSTQFNGKTLFDGSFGNATFQVGANAGQTITTTMGNFRTNNYGVQQVAGTASQAVSSTAGAAGATITAGSAIVVNGTMASGTYTTVASDTAKTVAEGINNLETGVTASADTKMDISFAGGGNYALTVASDNSTGKVVSFALGTSGTEGLQAAVDAFNNVAGDTGVTAKVNDAGTGVTLENSTGNDIALTGATTNAAGITFGTSGTTIAAGAKTTGTITGQVTLDSSKSFSVTDASGLGLSASSTLQSVSTLDVTTVDGATAALNIVDAAMASVDDQRASLGAIQNRFEHTIANLQSVSQNISAASSQITDADFAAETANMSRAQILQQAGIAMVAQANTLPQAALTLLKG
jgi:flagellin